VIIFLITLFFEFYNDLLNIVKIEHGKGNNMIENLKIRARIIFVILITVSIGSSVHATDTQIRLGYSDVEAFPFQIRHDTDPPGIAMEILRQVAKDLGISIVFVRLPNKRVQYSLLKGKKIDGAFMYSFKASREVNGKYPMKDGRVDEKKRLASLSYYIYKLKKNPLQWNGQNFSGVDFSDKNMKIGANSGYSIVSDLEKMGLRVDEGGKSTDQNFVKLFRGRITGFAHQDLVADNYIKTKGIMIVEKLPIPLVTKPYFLMFSHQFAQKNPYVVRKFWDRIAEIRDIITQKVVQKYSE